MALVEVQVDLDEFTHSEIILEVHDRLQHSKEFARKLKELRTQFEFVPSSLDTLNPESIEDVRKLEIVIELYRNKTLSELEAIADRYFT